MCDLERITTKDIAYAVSDELGVIVSDIRLVLKAAFEYIDEQLVSGSTVTLDGLGSLGTKITSARYGRNIKTKEKVLIPPRREIVFSMPKRKILPVIPSKALTNSDQ
jgi:nucleoid DNA-binding protein